MTSNDTDNEFEKKQLWYAVTQYPEEKQKMSVLIFATWTF